MNAVLYSAISTAIKKIRLYFNEVEEKIEEEAIITK